MTKWLDVARRYDGEAEVAGAGSNPVILAWIAAHGRPDATDDSAIAWCGFFMAGVFTEAGLGHVLPAEPGAARSWRAVGEALAEPREGAVVVMARNDPTNPSAAHVGFVVGVSATHIMVLAGNQGNRVSVAPFPRIDAAYTYRWPVKEQTPAELASSGESRIAAAARRQQRDATIAGTAGGATQVPLTPDTVITAATKAPPPPPKGVVSQAVDGLAGDLSKLKQIGNQVIDFATFVGVRWQWVALGVAFYFGLRFLYDARMIGAWRAEDANKGYST
jgi:uncharacterized protein (TIGR02594 family)